MQPFKHNCYIITLEDLDGYLKDFPYSKVLQCKWDADNRGGMRHEFKKSIRGILKEYKKGGGLPADTIENIVRFVEKAKLEHPSEFPKKGWYDKKVWRELPGNEPELAKYIDKLVNVAKHKATAKKLEEDLRLHRLKQKGILINFIKALDKKVFSIRDVKPCAELLNWRTLQSCDLCRLLGNQVERQRNGYVLLDARDLAIKSKAKTYIDEDGHECLV